MQTQNLFNGEVIINSLDETVLCLTSDAEIKSTIDPGENFEDHSNGIAIQGEDNLWEYTSEVPLLN